MRARPVSTTAPEKRQMLERNETPATEITQDSYQGNSQQQPQVREDRTTASSSPSAKATGSRKRSFTQVSDDAEELELRIEENTLKLKEVGLQMETVGLKRKLLAAKKRKTSSS